MRTALIAAVALAAVGLAPAPRASASNELETELTKLAKSIKDVLDEQNQSSIGVGDFTGPTQIDSQFGPGIRTSLTTELEKLKVTVSRRADLSVSGNYADARENDDKIGDEVVVVKIFARVLARDGSELVKLSRRLETPKIKDNATIAQITGATTALPAKAGEYAEGNEKLKEALDKPSFHLRGNRVSATKHSDYGVELLVAPYAGQAAVTREVKDRDGQAFVPIEKAEIYEVKLYNDSALEAAVSLSVDGVDAFAFGEDKDAKTGKCKYSHFIVKPRSSVVIKGWFVTADKARSDNVLRFLVTELGKGAAGELKCTGSIGVVTATFRACSEHPNDLPPGERDTARETAKGPPEKVGFEEVKRFPGVVKEVISVRYSK